MLAHNEEGAFWQRTQELLQSPDAPLVRKPKLTENLLRKPPFRFLHDVICEIQRNTGFASALYTEFELNSSNVKDKDSKVNFLNKIIDTVAEVTGRPKAAKSLKVVAGLEPENTNAFLQQLAEAATTSDGSDAVARVLGIDIAGGVDNAASGADEDSSFPARDDSKQLSQSTRFGADFDNDRSDELDLMNTKTKESDFDIVRNSTESSTIQYSSGHVQVNDNSPFQDEPAANNTREPESATGKQDPQPSILHQSGMQQPLASLDSNTSIEPPVGRLDSGATANNIEQQPQSSLERGIVPIPAPRFIRPSSARKGPPRLKQTEASKVESSSRRGSISSEPLSGGATTSTKSKGILVDDGDDEDEEDVVVVMPNEESRFDSAGTSLHKEDDTVAGKLVSNMLAEKDQLEQQASSLNETSKDDTEDDKPKGIVLRRRLSVSKTSDSSFGDKPQKKADLNVLRESIQNLCQYTAPLTKTLDYIQEDVDNMNKELQHWSNETKINGKLYGKQDENVQANTEQIQFNTTVAELDMDIVRQKEKIHSTKSQILRNEMRIQHLLQLVVNGSCG